MKVKLLKYWTLLFSVFLFIGPSLVLAEVDSFDGFDYPLGRPDGLGYGVECCGGLAYLERYDYQKDGLPEFHPGEDWNDDNTGKDFGGDRNDKGDPVYSIGNGRVIYAEFGSKSWGYLVLIEHVLPGGKKAWSQYAHLSRIDARFYKKTNIEVRRGEEIGRVGDYWYGSGEAYHLHFELRKKYRDANAFVPNWSKEKVQEYYYNPSEFIRANRPVAAQEITVSSGEKSAVNVSWEASPSSEFSSYQLYRAEVVGGTGVESKRTLVFSSEDKSVTNFRDLKAPGPKTYWYSLFTTYKNGQVGISAEKSVEQKREIIQLTDNPYHQMYPRVYGGRVYWQDWRIDANNRSPKKLFYYDLEASEERWLEVNAAGASGPISNNNEVCYVMGSSSRGRNIYCYSYESKSYYPVVEDPKEQYNFDLSGEGVVVWTDTINGNNDIYYLDLRVATGRQEIVVAPGNQSNPAIWGNTVVWRDGRRGGNKFDLYYKELGGEEQKLVDDCGAMALPKIWEDWVAWSNNGKVSMINIQTREVRVIDSVDSNLPRIRDGKIVYQKQEGEGAYIWVYEINTAQKIKIDFFIQGGWYAFPDIYGNVVVWAATENANGTGMNIFMTRL